MRRKGRLVVLHRQDEPVVPQLLDIAAVAVDRRGNDRRHPIPGRELGRRVLAQDQHQHLVGRQGRQASPASSRRAASASGRTISTTISLGTWPFADGNHHLKTQVGSLFLQEPGLAAIIHLLRPPEQLDRIGLQETIVVVVVGPHLEQ